jgi:hypothetical protein
MFLINPLKVGNAKPWRRNRRFPHRGRMLDDMMT